MYYIMRVLHHAIILSHPPDPRARKTERNLISDASGNATNDDIDDKHNDDNSCSNKNSNTNNAITYSDSGLTILG